MLPNATPFELFVGCSALIGTIVIGLNMRDARKTFEVALLAPIEERMSLTFFALGDWVEQVLLFLGMLNVLVYAVIRIFWEPSETWAEPISVFFLAQGLIMFTITGITKRLWRYMDGLQMGRFPTPPPSGAVKVTQRSGLVTIESPAVEIRSPQESRDVP
jgi:hypothetical protein